ncbi:zonadhesin-like [Panonychus citri]|uniref:zonadhesin-like n=1 Tax=Panonychus citri TaxID=50023 RepID=UPI002307413D|nr:zonadhesin-like [Panonychus citri]
MSFLIISIVVNCFVLIASAQDEASAVASADSFASAVANSSAPLSGESKARTADKVYNPCGTVCPLTCAQPKPRGCIRTCKAGYLCPDGYYENSQGKCVLLEDCDSAPTTTEPPRHLPGHIVYRPPTAEKVYSECGSTCPLKCSSPKPQICNALCRPGFACPKGYYENSADKCVLPEYCDSAPTTTEPPRHLPGHIVGRPRPRPRPFPINDPSPSWPNEFKPRTAAKVYNECGTACPKTCAQPNDRPCILICKEGWFCPSGYYENSVGECVLLEDCDLGSQPPRNCWTPRPQPALGNQEQLNIAEYNKSFKTVQCFIMKYTLVFLVTLFVIVSCSAEVQKEYKSCGSACPPTCANPNPQICTMQCVSGYFCPRGYVLNRRNRCVRVQDC